MIYGYYGDNLAFIHQLWQGKPFANPAFVYYLPALLVSKIFNETVAYNFLTLTSLLLAFLITFLFVKKLAKDNYSALIGGTIFAFSSYWQWQARAHPDLEQTWTVALLVWSLFNYWQETTKRNLLAFAICWAISLYTAPYYAYFGGLLAGGYLVALLWRSKKRGRLILGQFISLGGLLTMFSLPLGVFLRLGDSKTVTIAIARNSLDEVFRLTARPWDYLLPSVYHPLWGKLVGKIYSFIYRQLTWQAWSAYLPERAIYLGYLPLVLAVFALARWAKERKQKTASAPVVFFVTLALLACWLSLPPYLSFHLRKIPLSPSYFLFPLLPMFRAYIRSAIFVQLAVAVLAGLGWQKLGKQSLPLTLGAVAIIIAENLALPIPLLKIEQKPPLYRWLKNQPGEVLVVEYPLDDDPEGGCRDNLSAGTVKGYNYTYSLNFQRYHQKEVYPVWLLPKETRKSLANLASAETRRFWQNAGVDYLLWHTKDYFATPKNALDPCQEYNLPKEKPELGEGFVKIAQFEDGAVYQLQ